MPNLLPQTLEFPTTLRLASATSGGTYYLGGNISIQTGSLGPVPLPPSHQIPNFNPTKSGCAVVAQSRLGICYVTRKGESGVRDPYLLVATHLDERYTSVERISQELAAEEAPSEDRSFNWFESLRTRAEWRIGENSTRLHNVIHHLNQRVLEPLWEFFGPPKRRGRWLAIRLCPGRLPGVLRVPTPTSWHLWIKL